MHCFVGFLVIFVVLLQAATCRTTVVSKDLVLVVSSQDSPHHLQLADDLKHSTLAQAAQLGPSLPVIILTHEDLAHPGSWTYLPIISRLAELHGSNSLWMFFCQDRTRIHLQQLLDLLSEYDATQAVWIGHGLRDADPTIIHHFTEAPQFLYPLLGVGFAVSTVLINSLASQLDNRIQPESDFAIDPAYEFSQLVVELGRGPALSHSPLLCLEENLHCATYYLLFKPCKAPVSNKLIHFAVKTCKKFHGDRIPVVQRTWAPAAKSLVFYSDYKDTAIPTVDLGIPNTLRGHCAKTLAIIRHAASELRTIKWLVIADDDTLLSIGRLQDLLSCYPLSKPMAIGERYGYNVGQELGYNYITGGGGIIINMAAVLLLAADCHCPSDSTPDDMYLGVCMARLNISIIHSPQFHQARPPDYAPEVLAIQAPISFHKHWMLDPYLVHTLWLQDSSLPSQSAHTEL